MSFSTITAAQRLEIRDSAVQVASVTQPFAQNGLAPTAAELALITPVLTNCAAALNVAGATGLLSTQVVVTSGTKVNAVSVTGTGNFATFTVVAGAITAIVLSAS